MSVRSKILPAGSRLARAAFVLLHTYWAPIAAIGAGMFAAFIAVAYATQPIVEQEAFRQTLTALTADWMIREGWQFAYQTPAWGYPWAAPIEFPIYQALVALIAGLGNLPLEPVGRLVTFGFLVAFAWPAFRIAERLGLPSHTAWIFCALVWSSPLYLFWGRTFMIDVAALFFTLAAIPYLLDLRGGDASWKSATLAALWGTIAMLQRSITAGPVLLVVGLMLLVPYMKKPQLVLRERHRVASLVLALGFPLALGVLWTLYSDLVKYDNLVGRELTLAFRLSDQYVGSIGQRINLDALREIFWRRVFEQNAAGFLGVSLVAGALMSGSRSVRWMVLICLVLMTLPILLFFSVSLFLDYYQVSSVVFLIAALAVCCTVWIPAVVTWRAAAPLAVMLLVVANLLNFWYGYGTKVRETYDVTRTRTLAVGDVVSRYAPEQSAIVVFGLHSGLSSLSPEIIYYSQRKGLTVPDWREDRVEHDLTPYLGGKELGAIVFCSSGNRDRYNQIIARHSEHPVPRLFSVLGCNVWLPQTSLVILADGTQVLPTPFLE